MAHRASMAEPEASISARPVGQDLVGEPSSAIRWHSAACPSPTTSWRRPLRRAGRPAPWAKRRQRRCRKRPPPDRAWWRSPEGGSPPRAQPAGSRSAAPVSHAKATAGAGAARCDAARAMRIPGRAAAVAGNLRCAAIAHFHFDRAIGEVETADAGVCFRGAARHVRSVRPVVTRIPSQACCGQ